MLCYDRSSSTTAFSLSSPMLSCDLGSGRLMMENSITALDIVKRIAALLAAKTIRLVEFCGALCLPALMFTQEICYTVGYVEPNERALGNPWSLRQCGLYHQLRFQQRTSCWINIFNQGEAYETLKREMPACAHIFAGKYALPHPFDAHVALLQQLCSFHWDDYIRCLGKELGRIVRQKCFS